MISHSRERLREVELVPFQKAIAAGVDAILAAHVAFPRWNLSLAGPALCHTPS